MSEYTFADLEHFLCERCFKPYEVKDNLIGSWKKEGDPDYQIIKQNCDDEQLIIDDRTGERNLSKGFRFKTFTGDKEWIEDEELSIYLYKLIHYYNINNKVKTEGYEGHTTLSSDARYWLFKLNGKKKQPPAVKRHNFFSCCPKYRIDISEGEVLKMEEFLKNNLTEKYFLKVSWVIESGKHKDKPNLHFHFLGLYNQNGSKNFRKRVLFEAWNKLYPNNPLEWKTPNGNRGIHIVACNTQEIINDKLEYLINGNKGSHINFVDLNKNYSFGF